MAIVDPISDVRRAMQTSDATEIFASTVVADIAMDTASDIPDRITEPLTGMGGALDEVSDVLLGDADEEEGNEGDAADEIAVLPRRRGKGSSRQAASVEDAFHSYLRDIRGLGLLTHAEEIELARRAADGDEQARRRPSARNFIACLQRSHHVSTRSSPCVTVLVMVAVALCSKLAKSWASHVNVSVS